MFAPIAENGFAVLTLIAAPAVFANAPSVLALGTRNRLARFGDRRRSLARELHAPTKHDKTTEVWVSHLSRLERRGALLVRAMKYLYGSIGAFARCQPAFYSRGQSEVFGLPAVVCRHRPKSALQPVVWKSLGW